jgi:hypothetical protein
MAGTVKDNWPYGQLIAALSLREDSRRADTYAEAQDPVEAALPAMYATLLRQPLSPQLAKFVGEIEAYRKGIQRGS